MAPRDTAQAIAILGRGAPVSIREAHAAGISRGQLRAAIAAGDLCSPRRGVVAAISGPPDDPVAAYRSRVLAYASTHPGAVFCSFTAAHLWNLPLPVSGESRFLHVIGARSRRTSDVWRHDYPLGKVITEESTGLTATHPLDTACHIATHYDLPLALIAMEAAIRRMILEWAGDPRKADHVVVKDPTAAHRAHAMLEELAGRWRHRSGATKLMTACAVASELSESPAESFSHGRLVLWGYDIEQQVEVVDADGVQRRLDFLIDGCVAGEVDGLMKYEGDIGRQRLLDEKRRDAALLAVGIPTARWTPAEIRDYPHVVRNRIDILRGQPRGGWRSQKRAAIDGW